MGGATGAAEVRKHRAEADARGGVASLLEARGTAPMEVKGRSAPELGGAKETLSLHFISFMKWRRHLGSHALPLLLD